MNRGAVVEPMYDVVLRASAPFLLPFLVGSPYKDTLFPPLSLNGDDVILFVLSVFWAWTLYDHRPCDGV
jgi:hypothetical protein